MNSDISSQISTGLLVLAIIMPFFWAISTLLRGFKIVYWWQVKEYRRDRMQAHRRTDSGKRLWCGLSPLIRKVYLLLLTGGFVLFYGVASMGNAALTAAVFQYFYLAAALLSLAMVGWWGMEIYQHSREVSQEGVRLPKPTLKALILILVVLVLVLYGVAPAVLFYPGNLIFNHALSHSLRYALATPYQLAYVLLIFFGYHIGFVFGATILSLLLSPLLSLAVLMLAPLTRMQRQAKAVAAHAKLRAMADLQVVGITGSYGKSSTKEMLADLLVAKFNVMRSPKNHNTAIGLASFILGQDFDTKAQILVAEMGAYTGSEIKEMTQIARPHVAIVTAVNEQHLDLFGSIERTLAAKYEIVEALPEGGMAVFNADNDYCRAMAKKFNGKKMFYSTKGRYQVSGHRADVLAMNIQEGTEHVEFDLVDNRTDKTEKIHVHLAVIGAQYVSNFLAAVCGALCMGMSLPEIGAAAGKITAVAGAIVLRSGVSGTKVVDDSYSTNPAGFLAALKYLEQYKKGRKVVVTKGMMELGDDAARLHREVGAQLAAVADVLVLLDKTHEQSLREGIGHTKGKALKTVVGKDINAALDFLEGYLRKGDVLLLEGRLPVRLTSALLAKGEA